MKLYELANDYLALMQAIDNGEIPEEALVDTLESITAGIEEKADNIACLLKNIEADIKAFKDEEARLAKRRKSKEKAYERIQSYLSSTLLTMGITELESARSKISFIKSESVEVDADFLEWAMANRDDLVRYKAEANKTEIKKALAEGVQIKGAKMVINQNIQIN